MATLRSLLPHTAPVLLAALLLAMAAGQLSNPSGFSAIIGTYDLTAGAGSHTLAAALIVAETAAGAALLTRRYRLAAAMVAVVVALFWTALAGQAFVRGLDVANCGCFGVHLGQELRWWVLLEDAELILWSAWVLRRGLQAQRRPGARSSARAAGAAQPAI